MSRLRRRIVLVPSLLLAVVLLLGSARALEGIIAPDICPSVCKTMGFWEALLLGCWCDGGQQQGHAGAPAGRTCSAASRLAVIKTSR
jgi:hypothetical protein